MAQHLIKKRVVKTMNKPQPRPPVAKKINTTNTRHKITRHDEYAWMRDDNWQDVLRNPDKLRPDIHDHLKAENSYTDEVLKTSASLRDKIYNEMRGRVKENDTSPPLPKGIWEWFSKYETGQEHQQICRQKRTSTQTKKKPEIILDANKEASGLDYFKLGETAISPGQEYLAWSHDANGSEYFTIKIREIATGKDLSDILTNTSSVIAWSLNARFIFYILLDENHRPSKVMRHKIGTSQADDVLVYEEEDAGFFVSLSQSRSESLIFISAHDHETSEVHMINAADPEQKPVTIAPREPHIEYEVSHDAQRNRLIILTNKDAVDFRLMWANIETPDKWHELVPHKKGTLILKVATYENFIVWLYREKALPKINILSTETNLVTEIAFKEEAYDLSLDMGLEYNTNMVRFIYTSMTTPRQIFDHEMSTGKRNMVYEQSVPSGHNAQDYITKRLWAPIEGVDQEIPITILYHKDTPLDGSAPVLLYGYGAYGISIPASFSGNRLSLVDRGFIYAIAHIRGGKEMGFDWFLQGRKENKINSFKDFAAAAEYLIDNNLTQKGNITIHGGSAGGLLVGATLNLKPDLFRGAVAEVPFVDVLNTMLDDTLPLTPPEWPEWGNPILNAADYQMIAEYAPYENISKKAYPHILATAGLTDPRVTYWEPAKWVARLRDNRSDDGLTLLRTEMSAGHGGKAGRFNQLEELAMVYGFVLSIHQISN